MVRPELLEHLAHAQRIEVGVPGIFQAVIAIDQVLLPSRDPFLPAPMVDHLVPRDPDSILPATRGTPGITSASGGEARRGDGARPPRLRPRTPPCLTASRDCLACLASESLWRFLVIARYSGERLRAFQISSHGHWRAHSRVTVLKSVVAPSDGRTSIMSSTSKPLARSKRIQSP